MIDKIISNPPWNDNQRESGTKEQYIELFDKIHLILKALVSDRNVVIEQVTTFERPLIPDAFVDKDKKFGQFETLPREVVAWIKEERLRQDNTKQSYALVNTFFLLMVIGAFGSLIFLMKDYIERQEDISIASLVFRPILGMFLAMAVFIVTIFGHTVVSTADILKIRAETLYLLALAAGLLSDEAYQYVRKVASERLKEEEKRSGVQEKEPSAPQTSGPS